MHLHEHESGINALELAGFARFAEIEDEMYNPIRHMMKMAKASRLKWIRSLRRVADHSQ